MQAKVTNVGFRIYQVLNIDVTDTETYKDFTDFDVAESIIVRNTGAKDVIIKFNKIIYDRILIPAGATRELPIKAGRVYAYCPQATDTSKLEVIGFAQ